MKKATEVFLSKISKSANWSGGNGGGLGAMENGTTAGSGGAGVEEGQEGGGGISDLIMAILSKPIELVFAWTVPDCSTQDNQVLLCYNPLAPALL